MFSVQMSLLDSTPRLVVFLPRMFLGGGDTNKQKGGMNDFHICVTEVGEKNTYIE
jgi:hypothetical protein